METDPIQSEIEAALGHTLDPRQAGTLRHLNDVTPTVLDDARRLPPILSLAYLRYLADNETRRYLTWFLEDVVLGERDPTTWRRGGVLVPSLSIEELLTFPVASLLAPVQRRSDEPWLRFPLNEAEWKDGDYFPGAPGVERPSLHYASDIPAKVLRFYTGHTGELERVDDIEVSVRRWIASRAAAVAEAFHVPLGGQNAIRLAEAIAPSAVPISGDARMAIEAFLREYRAGLTGGIPGFRGPDAWYRDEES